MKITLQTQTATNQQLSPGINSLSRSYHLIHSTPPRKKLLFRNLSTQHQVNRCFKCSPQTLQGVSYSYFCHL